MNKPDRLLPKIDAARCTGCGWCVASCHVHLLTLETRRWKKTSVLHDADRCTGCRKCAVVCPFQVISMQVKDAHVSQADVGALATDIALLPPPCPD